MSDSSASGTGDYGVCSRCKRRISAVKYDPHSICQGCLGSPGHNSLDSVEKALSSLRKDIKNSLSSPETEDDAVHSSSVQETAMLLLSKADDATKLDTRLTCACYALAIIQEIHMQLRISSVQDNSLQQEEPSRRSLKNPPAAPDLISVHQMKIIEDSLRLVIYTLILGCLSKEASQYVKVMLARNKFALGPSVFSATQNCSHCLLASSMKIIVDVMEHDTLGAPLRGTLFPEILSALLELCFAPGKVKEHPEDTAFFREHIEKVLSVKDPTQTLQHLLLLKGIAKNGGWLQKVCGSFIVRRYMMQPNGVTAVIGAGLAICDGQNLKQCEAVAAIIAHAKFPNMDLFYSSVGPQISELILKTDLKPEILRVVMLIVSELAQRSATLTSLHVTNELLKPLLYITDHQPISESNVSNLTMCVTRTHKLFVEVGVLCSSLTNLLRPVISPLISVAAFPTSHLRSLAQQCIIRYLSQLTIGDAAEVMLHVTRVQLVPSLPIVNCNLNLCLDDEGGIRTNISESSQETLLENDENLAKTIALILEKLKNPSIVRLFCEKLVLHIDFSVLNKDETATSFLLTEDDIRNQQFGAVRKLYISCSLLSTLTDSEQLMGDLFQDFSAAVPIVDTLLKASCQKCEDDALNRTKLGFLLNVVMMVSWYVNEQMMRKKMCSEDWNGLKLLLPSLEKVIENISDEGILLFVEGLKSLILTHGVIGTVPSEVVGKQKKGQGSAEEHLNHGKGISENIKVDNSKIHNKIPNVREDNHCLPQGFVSSSSDSKNLSVPCGMFKNESNGMKAKQEGCLPNVRSSYKEAMEDVLSPLLPVRGHGLLSLTKLIEEQDCETIANKKKLLTLLQHNLKEEDSYIYLMAIQGLAVLCDTYPEKVVDILTQEFRAGNRSVEDRAKLAEVLSRASRRLGPLLSQYSSYFLNSLLDGVRDSEAVVRASSLSSLGEVCKVLRFSLGPIIFEIFGVLQNVIGCDKAVEVRRAAVLVVTLILQGLGQDAFSVLKDVIRDLYRVLRLVNARDPDDVVRVHTQLAIEEIDTITKKFLLPKLNLTKKIYVADIPPSLL